MNEANIRKYAGLMKELGLTGLEITEGEKKVRLERALPAGSREAVAVDPTTAQEASTVSQIEQNTDYISVKSPVVGVFYAAAAENASPYVTIGDRVQKGQILCIVEAMKLMNEITAQEDGTVLEICVTNGQVVEFGTELFHIKRIS